MGNHMFDINISCHNITEEEFNKLSLDNVNYSRILFIFTEEYNKLVTNKLITEWQLGKSHRLDTVIKTGMFYVENCDIQTIDSERQLFSEIYYKDSIKEIYILGDADEL